MMREQWKIASPRGIRPVNCRERMNIMRVYGVFIPGYGAIEWSSNKRVPQMAMFTLGSFSRHEAVRNDGFSKLRRFLRLSHKSTWNIFDDERFAAKSKFELE